ncbi:metalloregulator ArsR/SmtB family transcription factor [Rothia dentocariosa]|uniref:metalloregulator ArsR/SmtB family transcription factor n=1 Tax=Rothia dentocariosa TaxID=2047 RepID=UPI0001E06D33|nr:metalloregulator ArsR/SmtB family transcription factor [Rothia dentocariosa]EFJ77926.1 transcriptional regulator, ArsR family [Rothia dentocariosa M567]QKI09796.1 metalloregulator ArsR/SmtB family transcription factor [Rothia dentocariosa]TFI35228.1 metalloregulator ArsR/SmtB family transcription factor [Rothia dentocariosa]
MQSDVFSVIADPTRRNIVHLLAEQTRTVGAVVEHLNMSQPTISKHLKVLREARAVTVLVEGQRRLYSLNPEVFDEITAWVADIQAIAHSTKEQRESQIKQASVIEVVDVVESSGDDTAKTEKTEEPSAEAKTEKTAHAGESETNEQKQQDTEQRPKATGKTTDETAGEAATAHAQDVQDQDKTSDSDAPAQPVESSSVVEQPEPTPQERVSKTLSQRKRFEAFPGSTGSANAGVKPGASLSSERDAEKVSGQKDRDGQGASHEAGAHDSHTEGESSAKKKTTTAAIAKPAIFDDEARSAESSVTSGLGPKTSTKSAARIVSKPAQQAAPAASEEGTETAGTVEENEFIPMRPFTPSGSSYQEKPQQSYGYDDGIDDGQQGFSPEARGFVPRSKSQDRTTAQAKPEAVKTDKDASAQKDAESSVKSTESAKAPARSARSHDTKQPHIEAQTQERTHVSGAQQPAQQSEGAKPVKPNSAESKQTSHAAKAEAQKPVKDAHKSAHAKPQKPESPSPQAQTAAKTESAQAQSVREEVSAPKPGSERAAQAHTGKPGAKTEAHTGSQEPPAQAAKPAESPMQAAASEKKPEDKPAETTATNAQTATQPGTSSTVSYGIDTAEKSTENGERAVQGTAQKKQTEKGQGNAGSPDTKEPAKPATVRSAKGTASTGAAAKTQEPEKKPAAQVEESSSTAQEPQKSGAETPAEAAPAAAQNMTQAQSEEAKAVEAKLAENAPVKSDSVTFTAVLPVVTPEMSSVQGARPQEDEEAADASDKTKSTASEKSGKNEELPYQTQTEYTSAFGTADTPKEPPRGLLSRVFGRRR